MERKMIRVLLVVALLAPMIPTTASASCTYASDRASDGSRCGGRASSERAGGK